MADKLPMLKCPLKLMGLMSNPAFVKNIAESPDFMTNTLRDRPVLVKCEREKCGFYSSYQITEDVEDDTEAGSHEETHTIEGCAIALLPERLHDVSEVAEGMEGTIRTMSLMVMGAAKLGAQKYGLMEEFEKLSEAAAEGEEYEEEEEGEEEEQEQEAETQR